MVIKNKLMYRKILIERIGNLMYDNCLMNKVDINRNKYGGRK